MTSIGTAFPAQNAALFPASGRASDIGQFSDTGVQNRTDTHPPPPAGDAPATKRQPQNQLPGQPPQATPPGNSASNISLHNLTDLQEGVEEDAATPGDADGLSKAENAVVEELKARDLEVHAHERAHANAGGQYAGAMSFGYTTGPDGQRYATSGEVGIDMSPIAGDPEATIDKMQVIINAALAPAQPSGQDRSVAQAAKAMITEAEGKLAELNARKDQSEDGMAGAISSDPNSPFAPASVDLVV